MFDVTVSGKTSLASPPEELPVVQTLKRLS